MFQMDGDDRLRVTLLDHMSTVETSRSSLTGLTLEAVLMADKNVTSPQSNQTLLDVIQREHIHNHGGDNGTVWISSNSIPTPDSPIPFRDNEYHQLGQLLSNSGNVPEEASSAEGRLQLGVILAEERVLSTREEETPPARMSLMELLEENEGKKMSLVGVDGETAEDRSCCVCMVRRKGAAFIPCGHTFCRLCSRELWVQRGNCPLCNTSILQILHLF